MRTPYQSVFEPFTLRSNRILFHDWRYVSHGGTCYVDPDGKPVGIWGEGELPPLSWRETDNPSGIRLRALPAAKTEPFLSPEAPWEGVVGAPTVVQDGGRYRLWYEVTQTKTMDGKQGFGNLWDMLCYAESDDGMTWKRPRLDIVEYEGDSENNIVYGGPLTPEWGYHGGSVFLDPSAPDRERYKAFHLVTLPEETLARYVRERPGEIDPFSITHGSHSAVCGAVSPDGLHWTRLPDPLVVQTSDTQNICCYDAFLKKYVGYFRIWIMGRRSIGRAETDDYRRFPLPEPILWPDAGVGPSDTWYGNGKTVYPGADDYHLLFPKRWCVAEDRFYIHMATSPDGVLWGFPPDNDVLYPGERGAWDTGGVSVGCGMVELPGDRVGVIFDGYRVPHKHPRRRPLGELAWAWWERGRLVALEAPEDGQFRTARVVFRGNRLLLNVRTNHVGSVRVEVIGADGQPAPGHTFEDCDPVSGNFLDHLVTWKGRPEIPRKDDEPVAFRVRMASAELFEMRFE